MDKVEIFIRGEKVVSYDHDVIIMVFNGTSVEVIAPKNALNNPENSEQVHLVLAINHMLANNTRLTKQMIDEFDDYVLYQMPNKSDIVQ